MDEQELQEHIRKIDMAREIHASHRASLATSASHTISFAQTAINSAVLMNAGALAAILGYAASTQTDKLSVSAGAPLAGTLLCLVAGLVSATAAGGFSYVAQYCYTLELQEHTYHWDHPYIDDASTWRTVVGGIFHLAAVLAVVASLALFSFGSWRFFRAIDLV